MIDDPYEPLPKVTGENHKRPGNVTSGHYFCFFCGAPVTKEAGIDHGPGKCEENRALVEELRRINGW